MVSGGIGLLLGAALATGGSGIMAQDATPVDGVGGVEAGVPRPAHIHEGTCDELGGVVAPLTDLTRAEDDAGTTEMQLGNVTDAIPAEYSYTSSVPLALDDILANNHAVNVHESAENIENYIACGDLGGTVDANGSLVVGLGELNNSGYTGIAVLTADEEVLGQTNVSVFIANHDMMDAEAAVVTPTPVVATDELDEELGTPVAPVDVGTPDDIATPAS